MGWNRSPQPTESLADGGGPAIFQLLVKSVKDEGGFKMATYKPGAYHIVGDGYLHDLPLTISFTADQLVGIEVAPETKLHGLEKEAIPQVVTRLLMAQTVDIDAVTGATVTSDGLVDAVTDVIDAMPTTDPDGPAHNLLAQYRHIATSK